jgi:uncharacterized membrane protein
VAWAIALPLAPLAVSRPHGGPVMLGFIYGVYTIGRIICHQIPARSFHLWATPMPVCARCTGIYLGAAVAAALLLVRDVRLKPDATTSSNRTNAGPRKARVLFVAAAIPTAATLVYQWTTGDTPANWIRAVAGAPIGVAVAWIVREVN